MDITVETLNKTIPTLKDKKALQLIVEVNAKVRRFCRYDSRFDTNCLELANRYIQNHAFIENPIGSYYSPDPIHYLYFESTATEKTTNTKLMLQLYGLYYSNGLVIRADVNGELSYTRLWIDNKTYEIFNYPAPNPAGYGIEL